MFVDCMKICGVANNKCKNVYCSGNPKYTAPAVKKKVKQGAGHPTHRIRAKIPKEKDIDRFLVDSV